MWEITVMQMSSDIIAMMENLHNPSVAWQVPHLLLNFQMVSDIAPQISVYQNN